jgi:hypothetical protein
MRGCKVHGSEITAHFLGLLSVTESAHAPADSGATSMSILPQRIFQSEVHRARAIVCEQRALEAPDAKTRAEWTELAIEWHLMATVNSKDEKSAIELIAERIEANH